MTQLVADEAAQTTAAEGNASPVRLRKHRQRSIMFGLLAAVVVVDQGMKWWAWRHFSAARINAGGDVLVGTRVGDWFSDPVQGALLDLLDVGLLCLAISLLARRRRSVLVLVTGSLAIAGWTSNLFDRLVMHYWTAPGSVRGVVDYIHIRPHYYNVADLCIISATPLVILALLAKCLQTWVTKRPATTRRGRSTALRRSPTRSRLSACAAAVGLVVVVGLGAANDSGTTAPSTASGASR
jgi:lipoprotein signal peptidase